MLGERGPDGKRHLPSYRTGCFYERVEDCCWVCYLRFVWRRSDPELHEANHGADSIVGTEFDVPVIDRRSENECVEYHRGRVTDVLTVSEDDSAVVAVELETGERIAFECQSVR